MLLKSLFKAASFSLVSLSSQQLFRAPAVWFRQVQWLLCLVVWDRHVFHPLQSLSEPILVWKAQDNMQVCRLPRFTAAAHTATAVADGAGPCACLIFSFLQWSHWT